MFELYLLTFNCARTPVDPTALAPAFFDALPKDAPLPDLVAISLQELAPIAYSFLGGSYLSPYFERITTAIHLAADQHSRGSELYEHVATRSLGMTALVIFGKPKLVERIKWIQSAGAGVGFSNMGNKGAVAMRLGISCPGANDTLDLTFTAAHLAPMESNVGPRNKDWENIVRNLVFLNDDDSAYSSSEERPLLASTTQAPADRNGLFTAGNHVWFYGDLNYRTNDRAPGEDAHLSYPQPNEPESSPLHYLQGLKTDQLLREKQAKRTLHGFLEMPITFPPTYKLSSGSSSIDGKEKWVWSKHRYPSWCDRILYLPCGSISNLQPQIYTALPIQKTSDHRPVALSIRVEDRPNPREGNQASFKAPFSINPQWEARRDAARRWEMIVGGLSYLVLTGKGNVMLATFMGALLGTLWLTGQLLPPPQP